MAEKTETHKEKAEEKAVKAEAQAKEPAKSPVADNKSVVPEKKEAKAPEVKQETKVEEKKEVKEPKKVQAPKVKKEEAIARGVSLPISKKHGMYICTFIKNKTIDGAIADLQDVIKFKRAVSFKGEIPHRKGAMMSGRYPIKASKYFINLLKALKGNVIANGMDLDKTRIVLCVSNWAPRPQMKGGARFKRAHINLTAREVVKESKKENKETKKEKKQ